MNQKLKKNRFFCVKSFAFVSLITAAFMSSCASIKSAKEVYVPVDYTKDAEISNEIAHINELPENQEVKALWKAKLLEINAPDFEAVQDKYQEVTQRVVSLYNKALEEKDYITALRYYKSLKACDYKDIESLSMNESELKKEGFAIVPGLQEGNYEVQKKVSSYIKGTVTVYVDKGVKIERGMGYLDSVLGSGFFISKDGYIVTNHHVISDCVNSKYEGYSRLYVKLADDPETKIPAKVVGYDSVVDLALLKIEVDAPYVFSLGSSQDLEVGDTVYAIGSPLGLDRTLTQGIISAADRTLFTMGKVFQTNAAVNSGNSGGPLIDKNGKVQAVVFAGVPDHEGLNFAIPVEYLKYELPYLYHGGNTDHPWMGSYGKTKRLPGVTSKNEGLTVNYVMPDGSAGISGLKEDMVICKVDDFEITSIDDMHNFLLQNQNNTIIKVYVKDSEDNVKSYPVYLEKRPENPGVEIYKHDLLGGAMLPILGMQLIPISSSSTKKFTISKIIRGSAADEAGFSENDPVQILSVEFNEDKSYAQIGVYGKKRSNGYLDVGLNLPVSMDSPYYF